MPHSLFTEPETFKLAVKPEEEPQDNSEKVESAFEAGVRSVALQTGLSLISEGILGFTEFESKIGEVKDIRFAATQEEIKGKQSAAIFLEELNDMQASNIVLAFAQGRQLTGSVVSIQQALGLKAAHSITVAKLSSQISSLALTRQADEAEALAEWEEDVAPFNIITGIALTALSFI